MIQELPIQRGFWRVSENSSKLYKCSEVPEACIGFTPNLMVGEAGAAHRGDDLAVEHGSGYERGSGYEGRLEPGSGYESEVNQSNASRAHCKLTLCACGHGGPRCAVVLNRVSTRALGRPAPPDSTCDGSRLFSDEKVRTSLL